MDSRSSLFRNLKVMVNVIRCVWKCCIWSSAPGLEIEIVFLSKRALIFQARVRRSFFLIGCQIVWQSVILASNTSQYFFFEVGVARQRWGCRVGKKVVFKEDHYDTLQLQYDLGERLFAINFAAGFIIWVWLMAGLIFAFSVEIIHIKCKSAWHTVCA